MRMNSWQKHCFFKIKVRLDNGRDFSNVLNTSNPQLEPGAQPLKCFRNFMGCKQGIRV